MTYSLRRQISPPPCKFSSFARFGMSPTDLFSNFSFSSGDNARRSRGVSTRGEVEGVTETKCGDDDDVRTVSGEVLRGACA